MVCGSRGGVRVVKVLKDREESRGGIRIVVFI